MNTKVISQRASEIIDQYKNFKIGNAICSIPYFNNRRIGARAGLRVEIGKGSPKDIFDEIQQICFKDKIDINSFNSETLKKFLVDNDIGIDCSAFAYYILNEESIDKKRGTLDKHLSFPFCYGFIRKIKCRIRPIENTNVMTLAHNKNSKVISIKDAMVGDIITMINGNDGNERDHILIINQIDYQNFIPAVLHYVHSVTWPTDGEYGHGIHEGKIEILNSEKTIVEQIWTENEQRNSDNYTYNRAQKSITELRRINWF